MDARRGPYDKASRGKRKPKVSSHFDREIRKLESSVNYNRFPLFARGRGRSIGYQAIAK